MKTYTVIAKRVHEYYIEVEASNKDEARDLARQYLIDQPSIDTLCEYLTPKHEWLCDVLPD